MFCQFKDIFGKPNEGAHSYRIADIAVVDFVLTLIVAIILMYLMKSVWPLFIIFGAGIVAHRLFCVRTTVDKLLFENSNDESE